MVHGQNKRSNHIKRAFTIVELVIVMAIITVPIVSDNYELTQDITDLTLLVCDIQQLDNAIKTKYTNEI